MDDVERLVAVLEKMCALRAGNGPDGYNFTAPIAALQAKIAEAVNAMRFSN